MDFDQEVPEMEMELGVDSVDSSVYDEPFFSEQRATEQTKRKSKKRKTETDCEEEEHYDNFNFDAFRTMRRTGKEARRISGVYREIKLLHKFGHQHMDLVFNRMSTSDVMKAGGVSSHWYTMACHVLRKRLVNKPFLRFWSGNELNVSNDLMINWELHFHEQLLAGSQDEFYSGDFGELSSGKDAVASIQTIISVGNREAYTQFTHEAAKLPFRQHHTYAICENAIITAPNYAFTNTLPNEFPQVKVGVESLFIPKSSHFTMNGFSVELSKETWTELDVRRKIELPIEDLGPQQKLKAMLFIRHFDTEGILNFLKIAHDLSEYSEILVGNAEEIGYNKTNVHDPAVAVGYSIYEGPGANVTVYAIDFMKDTANNLLHQMYLQVSAKNNSFCFMYAHDARVAVQTRMEGDADDEDSLWEVSVAKPTPTVEEVLDYVHKSMPHTPIIGVRSIVPILAKSRYTNVEPNSSNSFTFGFVVVSYDD